jgi:ABC-type Fe3+ transport system permease subunit
MRGKQHKWITVSLLWLAPSLFLLLFYFYPLGSILKISLERAQHGLLYPFVEVLKSPIPWDILAFTFWQAFLSTLFTLALGLPGAYLFAHYDFRGKSILQALTGIPFLLPTLVVAAAFNALVGPSGWLNLGLQHLFHLNSSPIHFTNTLTAILVAHVFYNTTIVLRMVGDFWSPRPPSGSGCSNVGREPKAGDTLGDSTPVSSFNCSCCSLGFYFRFHFLWSYINLRWTTLRDNGS